MEPLTIEKSHLNTNLPDSKTNKLLKTVVFHNPSIQKSRKNKPVLQIKCLDNPEVQKPINLLMTKLIYFF